MHLSKPQAARFTRIMNSLVLYVGCSRGLISVDEMFDPVSGELSSEAYTHVLPLVWGYPELIDGYADANPHGLSRADIEAARRWRDCLSGPALLVGFDDDGRALFEVGGRVVAVQGIERSLTEVVTRMPPALMHVTLLPFGDAVVYDTLLRYYDGAGPLCPGAAADGQGDACGEPAVACADDLVALARAERARRHAEAPDVLRSWSVRRRRARVDADMPLRVHRGKLAGLPEDRRAQVLSERDGLGESELFDPVPAEDGSPADRAPGSALAPRVVRKLPPSDLAGYLGDISKADLSRLGRALGIDRAGGMRKAELVARIEPLFPRCAPVLERDLLDCSDEEFSSFLLLLEQPDEVCEISGSGDGGRLAVRTRVPFSQTYAREGRCYAVIPDAVRRLAGQIDLEAVGGRRAQGNRICHVADVLAHLTGVATAGEIAARCRELYGFDASEADVLKALRLGQPAMDASCLRIFFEGAPITVAAHPWLSARRGGCGLGSAGEGAWYFTSGSFRDGALAFPNVPWARRGTGREPLDGMRYAGETGVRDTFVFRLLTDRARWARIGPCPLDAALADADVPTWERGLHEAVRLRNWLDAHVPDGQDDYTFADATVARLLRDRHRMPHPSYLFQVAMDQGLFALSTDADELVDIIRGLMRALPSWLSAGWSPRAVHAWMMGQRVLGESDAAVEDARV